MSTAIATHVFQFLLRAATSPATAPLLNEAVQARFMGPIREWIGGEGRAGAGAALGGGVHRPSGGTAGARRAARRARARIFIERTAALLQSLVDQ